MCECVYNNGIQMGMWAYVDKYISIYIYIHEEYVIHMYIYMYIWINTIMVYRWECEHM